MFCLLVFLCSMFANQEGYYSRDIYYPSDQELQVYLAEGIEIIDASNNENQGLLKPVMMVQHDNPPTNILIDEQIEYQQINQPEFNYFDQMQYQQVESMTKDPLVATEMYVDTSVQPKMYESIIKRQEYMIPKNLNNSEQMFTPSTPLLPSFMPENEYIPAVIVPESLVEQAPVISEQLQMPVFTISPLPPSNTQPTFVNQQPPRVIPEPVPVILNKENLNSKPITKEEPMKNDKKTDSKDSKKSDNKKKDSSIDNGVSDILVGISFLVLLI